VVDSLSYGRTFGNAGKLAFRTLLMVLLSRHSRLHPPALTPS